MPYCIPPRGGGRDDAVFCGKVAEKDIMKEERNVPPTWSTMDEAKSVQTELVDSIIAIQGQLGDKNRTQNGERIVEKDYWEWKRAAMHALGAKTRQLREVKQWIALQNRQKAEAIQTAREIKGGDLSLLTDAHRIFRRLLCDGLLSKDEIAVADEIQRRLQLLAAG